MLADRVAELAAEEARRLVHTAARLVQRGEEGVLEAIERAAQHSAARIGLAAVAGVVDWAAAQASLSSFLCTLRFPSCLVVFR